MKKILITLFIFILGISIAGYFLNPFSAPGKSTAIETYIVPQNFAEATVIQDLKKKGFIKSFNGLDLALTILNKHDKIEAGGYYISKNMDAFKIANKITDGADLKWITFPEGLRKEQIGERLQKLLGWSSSQLDEWNNFDKTEKTDYFEGVYFPDTYLIPVTDDPSAVANRMISHFNDIMTDKYPQFTAQNILWTTGIRMASLIQREAAGRADMPLIAGIMWNRLDVGQKLQIDATIQYAKGKQGDVWWSVVTPSDIRNIDSLYNSYKYKGLPPHPISNPGVDAINAVLNPQKTDCIYYLHDHNRQIHCAVTYEEHVSNIEKYLN